MAPWQLVMLLGIVVLALAFFRPNRKPSALDSKQSQKELEETLEQFAYDLEEDNRKLMELVSELKSEHEKQWNRLVGRVDLVEKQMMEFFQHSAAAADKQQVAKEVKSPEVQAKAGKPIVYEKPLPLKKTDEQPSIETKPVKPAPDKTEGSSNQEAAPSPAHLIRDRYKQIFDLYHDGKSIEFIAKKMDMNKGEVQLIVQLAKQEEQFRV